MNSVLMPHEIEAQKTLKTVAPMNLVINGPTGECLGRFEFIEEKQEWTFIGNADAAAKQFVEFLANHFRDHLEAMK